MNMSGAEFSLKWSRYLEQVTGALASLRSSAELVDVTLRCEDGKVYAHRVLLAACSSFFRELFAESPDPKAHHVIVLRNVRREDLCSVISFMYRGEVSVPRERLASFLAAAELLEVRGLTARAEESAGAIPETIRVPDDSERPAENERKRSHPDRGETRRDLKQEAVCEEEDRSGSLPKMRYSRDSRPSGKTRRIVEPTSAEVDVSDMPTVPPSFTSTMTRAETEKIGADVRKRDCRLDEFGTSADGPDVRNDPPDEEKPYGCDRCEKSFKHPMSLRQHLKIHSGKTKCEYCAKVLSRVRDLQIHKNLIHGIND